MLALALWGCLAAAPVPASAVALAEAGELKGALVQVDLEVDAVGGMPIENMTRDQLRAELRRLDDERPSLGAPIAAVALGGGTIAAGFVILYISLIIALFGSAPITALIIGGVVAGGGAALLTVGIVMLRSTLRERKPFSERMDEVQRRLDGESPTDPDRAPPVPPGYDPSLPPPPPPAAGFEAVRPALVLARF